MNESSVYSEKDLVPFQMRLSELRDLVRRGIEQGDPEAMTTLLMRDLSECGQYTSPSNTTQPTGF
jgi:hypothetical protein